MEQDNAEMIIKKLKKEMMINRVFSIISMVMTTFILLVAVILLIQVKSFIVMAEPVMEQLAKIDMEVLNETLDNFNTIVEGLDFEGLIETLEEIDFESINTVMEDLDMEELSETLENINDGAEKLEKIGEWFEDSPLNFWGTSEE